MSRIQFDNRDGVTLTGTLELPPGGHYRATAVFAHCFTCGRDIRAAREITRALADADIAVLRFDFTGLGESEGDFADTTFSSNLDDLEDAAEYLGEELEPPQLLVGHSLGGAAVLAVAERLDSVQAIATIAAPSSPTNVLKHFDEHLDEIAESGSAEVDLAGRSFRIRRDFVEDARSHDLDERLARLKRALLVLHSPVDRTVYIEHAQRIFAAARHPKSFVSLDHADHLLSRTEDAKYAARVIAAWAGRFLEIDKPEAEEGVLVRGRTADGFLCRLQAGSHALIADEPQANGGNDHGPDPYQYLASALGACTVMTLNMYARHKKWPVERVSCRVRHSRIHAEDCEHCETTSGKVDRLEREITIEGDIDVDQRQRMLEIADRCPVHRTLESEIEVTSKLGSL
ncbi:MULTISPECIES: bifunctional alpha/beta hydrolase/OsmC family protein [unclassified Wenzhouxiangella]|uniref:bifunctional alpha/beta hydrolase/OsmC family protein n=1 Tax=unclassified Wenzhouxiangella TaxID=2613841 RepID=UPI001C6E41DE|nr:MULTISPECIES: bifunctional alpha/beta hydrolase/OsmC family protein [unclassified Wenzhouxiangella]